MLERSLRPYCPTQNTIIKDDAATAETRYFISGLPLNAEEAARAIRGHWMVESCHWQSFS